MMRMLNRVKMKSEMWKYTVYCTYRYTEDTRITQDHLKAAQAVVRQDDLSQSHVMF